MPNIEDRYSICPQMRVYDNLTPVIVPYITFASQPNFNSDVVNVDSYGFRVSHAYTQILDSKTWWKTEKRGIVLGGSFTFGVGATHDQFTLVSYLNSKTPFNFLNLGIRAGNSTQELIAAIPFLVDSEFVIVCSGVNNLVVSLQSRGERFLFCPLFHEETFDVLSHYSVTQIADLIQEQDNIGSELQVKKSTKFVRNLKKDLNNDNNSKMGTFNTSASNLAVEEKIERVLEIQKRDLRMLSKSISRNAQLIFAAQPFAGTCNKTFTTEERILFTITDLLQRRHWQIIKDYLTKHWGQYVNEIRHYCNSLGIRFIDLNEASFDGWCFVDRVHMTDTGYSFAAEMIAEVIE